MNTEIKRWGNSAAVRLSGKILAQAHLEISSKITIAVQDGKIIIEPTQPARHRFRLPFTEASLLEKLDANTAHADELAAVTSRDIGE